jgi:hypothetical protein
VATQKQLSEPYPMKAKGYGFFSETPIAQAKRSVIGKTNYPADAGFEGITITSWKKIIN